MTLRHSKGTGFRSPICMTTLGKLLTLTSVVRQKKRGKSHALTVNAIRATGRSNNSPYLLLGTQNLQRSYSVNREEVLQFKEMAARFEREAQSLHKQMWQLRKEYEDVTEEEYDYEYLGYCDF